MTTNGRITEKRIYIRIDEQDVIHCEKYSIPRDENSQIEGMTKNISGGGVLFTSKTPFEVGQILRLEISLAGWERFKIEFYKEDRLAHSKPIIVLATVVRVELMEDGLYDIGVCFAGIDEGHKWALLKYIDNRSTQNK